MMTSLEVKTLIELARAHGARRLKVDGFEVELGPVPSAQDEPRKIPIGDEEKAPTEDQLLFWSSGYQPEIEAEEPP